jgi:hypothetical protein
MAKSFLNILHQRSTINGQRPTANGQRSTILLVLLLSVLHALSQDSPSVKTNIDKAHILIGEPILFSIDVVAPPGSFLQLPQLPDSLPHFVYLGKGKVDSLASPTSNRYHLEWKLTSFDSGANKIPAFPVSIGDRRYQSDSLMVDVSFGNLDSLKDYHDIRGIIDVENPAVKYILWILLALTLLAIFLFIRFSSKPLPPIREAEIIPNKSGLSPYDEAMTTLDALKKMPLTDAVAVKKYYSGMNDVLRLFLNRTRGLATMVRTNEELILQLSGLNMPKEAFTHLASVLRMSDFVKFAKYIPDVGDNERNLEVIRSSIKFIHEIRK